MFSEEHHSTLAIFENSFEVSYVSYVSRPCEMKNQILQSYLLRLCNVNCIVNRAAIFTINFFKIINDVFLP